MNPISQVQFFDNLDAEESSAIPQDKLSSMLPASFQDITVRVFVRDASKITAAREATERFADAKKYHSPMPGSPAPCVKRPRTDVIQSHTRSLPQPRFE